MSELVEALRQIADTKNHGPRSGEIIRYNCRAAAERIEADAARIEKLEAALEPFDIAWRVIEATGPVIADERPLGVGVAWASQERGRETLTFGDLRRAYAARKENGK